MLFPMSWLKSFKKNGTSRLAEEIVLNAHSCTEQIMSGLRPTTEKERHTIWYQVLCKFLFCFLHLTDRLAFSVLGAIQRPALRSHPDKIRVKVSMSCGMATCFEFLI